MARLTLDDVVSLESRFRPRTFGDPIWDPEGGFVVVRSQPDRVRMFRHRGPEWAPAAILELTKPPFDLSTFQFAASGRWGIATQRAEGNRISRPCGDIWRIDLETGTFQRVTRTTKPQRRPLISPDGRWLGVIRSDALFAIDLSTGEERILAEPDGGACYIGRFGWVYEEELAMRQGWLWREDSSGVLAFIQREGRVPVSKIASFEGRRGRIHSMRYPKPGETNPHTSLLSIDLDGETVGWGEATGDTHYLAHPKSDRSGRILIQRMPRLQNEVELLRFDPRTMESETIWVERNPDGWVDLCADVTPLSDGSVLWLSEASGWRHLVRVRDGRVTELTSGAWEVTSILGCTEHEALVIAAVPDPTQRRIMRVPLDGGQPILFDDRRGVRQATMHPDGSIVIETRSSLVEPPRIELKDPIGQTLVVLEDNSHLALEKLEWAAPTIETFDAGGERFYAWLLPPRETKKPAPVFMTNYGGPGSQGVLDQWHGATFARYLNQRGYGVASVDNRGTGGRGRAWRQATYLRLDVLEAADQVRGAEFISSLPWADAERLVIFGWSYGGLMALSCLLRYPGVWRCGISVAPSLDWSLYDSIYTERFMRTPVENPDGYAETTMLGLGDRLRDELLIIHGTSDDNVHVQNTMRFIEALQVSGKPFEMMLYPHTGHGIEGRHKHLYSSIERFLSRHLGGRRRPLSSGS